MIKNPNQCCATVYQGAWPKPCSNPVKARIGDKCYCTVHSDRLNAAAPELLAALQAMVKMVTRTPMVDLPEVAQAMEAITKATQK